MKRATIEGKEVKCLLEKTWPPHWAKMGTAESLRKNLSSEDYERGRNWETICGLQAMAEKCLSCKYVRDTAGKILNADPQHKPIDVEPLRRKSG